MRNASYFLLLCLVAVGSAKGAQLSCSPPAALAARNSLRPNASSEAKLGRWFEQEGKYDCAAMRYQRSAGLDPASPQYAYLLGRALFKEGRAASAIVSLGRSIQLNSQAIGPRLFLGLSYERIGNRQLAERQWRAILSMDRTNRTALASLAHDLLEEGNYVAIIDLLRPLMTEKGLSPAIVIDLSVAYVKSGMLDNALSILRNAFGENSSSIPLAEALSAVLVLQSRYREAVEALSSLADQNPGDLPLQIRYLNVLVMDREPTATSICSQLLRRDPENWELLYLRGKLQRQAGHVHGAEVSFRRSIAGNSKSADAHFQLGLVHADLGNHTAAEDDFKRAIELGYSDPQVYYELGRSYSALGKVGPAQIEFRRYQRAQRAVQDVGRAATESYAGTVAETAGRFTEAAADYQGALDLDPKSPLLAYRLALLLDRTGDSEGERRALEQAIRNDPRMAVAYNQLGYLDSSQGNNREAIRNFGVAVRLDPGYAKAWMNLAAMLCLESHIQEARAALGHVLEISPDDQEANELLRQLNSAGTHP